jgi:hypothetical protein
MYLYIDEVGFQLYCSWKRNKEDRILDSADYQGGLDFRVFHHHDDIES